MGLASENTGATSTAFTRDDKGDLVGLRRGAKTLLNLGTGERHYFLRDGLGSIVALTDVAGTVSATYA